MEGGVAFGISNTHVGAKLPQQDANNVGVAIGCGQKEGCVTRIIFHIDIDTEFIDQYADNVDPAI